MFSYYSNFVFIAVIVSTFSFLTESWAGSGLTDGAVTGQQVAAVGVHGAVNTATEKIHYDGLVEKKIEDLKARKARLEAAMGKADDNDEPGFLSKIEGVNNKIKQLEGLRNGMDGTISQKMKALEQVAANQKALSMMNDLHGLLTNPENGKWVGATGGEPLPGNGKVDFNFDRGETQGYIPTSDANGKPDGYYFSSDGTMNFNSKDGMDYKTSNLAYPQSLSDGTAGTAQAMKGLRQFGPEGSTSTWSAGGKIDNNHWQHMFSDSAGKPSTVWDNGAASGSSPSTMNYSPEKHRQFANLGNGFESFSTASEGPVRSAGQIQIPQQGNPISVTDPVTGSTFDQVDQAGYPFLLDRNGNAIQGQPTAGTLPSDIIDFKSPPKVGNSPPNINSLTSKNQFQEGDLVTIDGRTYKIEKVYPLQPTLTNGYWTKISVTNP